MGPDCVAKLTEKQRACLRLVLAHYSSKEIARELGIGVDAVDQRLKSAMKNLGVQNRVEAARMLAEHEGRPTVPPARKSLAYSPSGVRPWFSWLANNAGKWRPRTRRARFIFWTCLLATIGGAIDLWAPLEEYVRDQRAAIRRHPASGHIVVVGIDNRSTDRLGNPPWDRSHFADLVRQLDRLGAERILFSFPPFANRMTPSGDAALAAALQPLGDRVVHLIEWEADPRIGKRISKLPLPEFRKGATLAHGTLVTVPRVARYVPYHIQVGDRKFPSFAYVLSPPYSPTGEFMPLDYATDPKTIQVVSAIDVIDGTVAKEKIERKLVLIGNTNLPLVDGLFVPGYGNTHGVIWGAIAIETLKSGLPMRAPWWLSFLPALAIAFLSYRSKSRVFLIMAFGGSILVLLILPYFLEQHMIFAKIMPPLSVLVPIGAGFAWSALRRRLRNGGPIAIVDAHGPTAGAKA